MNWENSPHQSKHAQMRCALLSNSRGDILIIHDRQLEEGAEYIQFDPSTHQIWLVSKDGTLQELGLEISEDISAHLAKSTEISLTFLKNKKRMSTQILPLLLINH